MQSINSNSIGTWHFSDSIHEDVPNYIPRGVGSLSIRNHHHLYTAYILGYISGYISHLLLLLCLLSTILYRLHRSFRGTSFQISRRTRRAFICIITAMLIMAFGITTTLMFPFDSTRIYRIIRMMLSIYVAMYIITAIYAVRLFSRKLLHLASTTQTAEDDGLVAATARYLACFMVAMLSTLVFYGYAYIVWSIARESDRIFHDTLRGVLYMIDQCVNQICLLLQYKFAKDWYHRCCTIPDRFCLWIIGRNTRCYTDDIDIVRDTRGGTSTIAMTQLTRPSLKLVPSKSKSAPDDGEESS